MHVHLNKYAVSCHKNVNKQRVHILHTKRNSLRFVAFETAASVHLEFAFQCVPGRESGGSTEVTDAEALTGAVHQQIGALEIAM